MKVQNRKRMSLHAQLSIFFLLLILAVAGSIGGYAYYSSRTMLESITSDLMSRINRDTQSELRHTLDSAAMAVNMVSLTSLPQTQNPTDRLQYLRLMQETLDRSDTLVSIYLGYGSGDFFLLRRLRTPEEIEQFKAPEGTHYILQSIERSMQPPRGQFIYMDAKLQVLLREDKPGYPASYDPRTRSWYKDALSHNQTLISDSYLFFTTQKVGVTISTQAEKTRTVVGVDIALDSLDEALNRQKVTPNTQLALVTPAGKLIAHANVDTEQASKEQEIGDQVLLSIDRSGIPVLAGLVPALKALPQGETYSASESDSNQQWRVSISPLQLLGSTTLYLMMAVPDYELMATVINQRNLSIALTLLILLASIPITITVARTLVNPIKQLAVEAEAIRRFDFSMPISIQSSTLEVDQLAVTMDGMKQTIRRFLSVSESVATEENFDRLLPILLSEAIAFAEAEAGVLYMVDAGNLDPAAALDNNGADLLVKVLPLTVDTHAPLIHEALLDQAPAMGDVDAAVALEMGLARVPGIEKLTYAVVVPLMNRGKHLIGCLLLLRAEAFDVAHVSFIKALSGAAASSLETRELIKAQRELFEAFIQLIAGAIDSKSPYTGGHCLRVPELTKMLARAACEQNAGPFKDFQLTEYEWEAVHVAAWLHDCGKMTTPDYVVDKATKLETIYDRIHEVRMRVEVLKRDAEIASLKRIAEGASETQEKTRLAEELLQLDEDFQFVAHCNEGGEYLEPEKGERLKMIAARTWQRTLDDRIGISYEELQRKMGVAQHNLPVTEQLLSDKPEHLFERTPQNQIAKDNPWGFSMDVPERLYNKGELHNLLVSRGTLTQEDRYKINEHIVQTIIMLNKLPFPKHLRSVPEIAGGHHEKMDGTGYPKRLVRAEMSPVARMMAIADIFEALTAADRPYKRGKTLSESIKIMYRMKQEHHIDPELFDLFLSSGVYLVYAERFMHPEQIDEVAIENYLG